MQKEKVMKMGLVSILLIMCVVLMSETVAEPPSNYYDDNAGTEENPYLVRSLANLRWLSEDKSVWGSLTQKKYFKQTADIDATETRMWNGGKGFSPIGDSSQGSISTDGDIIFESAFYGNYDGGNYTIKNLFMSPTKDAFDRFIGFFNVIQNSELKNIRLEEILFYFDGSVVVVGALCNIAMNSSIVNTSVTGTVILNGQNSGASGLVSSGINIIMDNGCSSVNIVFLERE